MKNRWIALTAVLAAIVAYGLTLLYKDRFEKRLTRGMEKIEILVARRSIARGSILTAEDLGKREVFKSSLTKRAVEVDQVRDILGKRVTESLERGDPLYWSDLDLPRMGRGGLQASVPKGERALSIAVDQTASVTGLVRPNDHVDILGTFTLPAEGEGAAPKTVTFTLLQDVTVLATGADMGRRLFREGPEGSTSAAGRYSTVTFAVTPEEAELLVFASQQGRLVLTLRNAEDILEPGELPQVDFQFLSKELKRLNDQRRQRTHPPAGSQ